jgi:beta-phosphoglucomutase-like phosphatase (HAD superfamily)
MGFVPVRNRETLRLMRAVIFDMDGLMVDSEPLARRAWERVLLDYGRNLDDVTFGRMVGLRLDESARLVQETYDLPADTAELGRRRRKRSAGRSRRQGYRRCRVSCGWSGN